TTTLFAALDVVEGRLIGQCMPRHRHQEFIKFLKQIDAETPPELDLHLIVDNYATHKHPKVQSWLKRHRRFHLHFIPTSSSWLNLVERWFREITTKRIRRGVFKSVERLTEAIQAYIDDHNSDPRPFVWTAKAKDILEKVSRARAVLDKIASERHATLDGGWTVAGVSCGDSARRVGGGPLGGRLRAIDRYCNSVT